MRLPSVRLMSAPTISCLIAFAGLAAEWHWLRQCPSGDETKAASVRCPISVDSVESKGSGLIDGTFRLCYIFQHAQT